jgi:plastocyanin
MRAGLVASLALAGVLALPGGRAAEAAGDGAAGSLRGRVQLAVDGVELADVGPVVVYLEPIDGRAVPAPSARRPRIHQKDASFSPGFLVIARGQSVDMPNDDAIYHNVFSYSKPNDFDLGLYPSGESRTVTFAHAGVVRTYCSIHESMSGTIFVAPTPWFAVARPSGAFEIRDVPAGSFRLRTWCERLPALERSVAIESGRATEIEVAIGDEAP